MSKKNPPTLYTSGTPRIYSYFMDKIFPSLVTLAIALCVWIVSNIFDLRALAGNASASDSYVLKETQLEVDKRQDENYGELTKKMDKLVAQQDAMILFFNVPVRNQ